MLGAAEDIRTKDSGDSTPMLVACCQGHLDVAKWLFEVGAAEDIRTKDDGESTPMFRACCNGHIDVAEWLLEVGAAEDICGDLMEEAQDMNDIELAKWLILHGILDRSEDDQLAFLERSGSDFKTRLRDACLRQLQIHAAFVGIILPVIVLSKSSVVGVHPKQRARRSELTSSLCLLCGHETTLVVLISDFAEMPRGRPLRRLREAVEGIELMMGGEGGGLVAVE